MLRVFGDAESYYDKIYSLRVLSPIEYILDDRWETLGWAVCIEREDPIILPQDDIVRFLKDIKQPYCFISHNALFDACILAYKYDINPDAMLCTLSMARSLLLHEIPNGSISLANVLKHLGLHPKGDFIQSMAGVHWADLAADPARMVAWAGYTINDVIGCRDIFFALCDRLPGREALAMDRVLRMATQPKLTADGHALLKYNMHLRQRKQELMTLAGKDRSQLMSNPQLAALLLESGVEPPMKISKTTGNPTYAFAKTDAAFAELLEHDNPDVQALVAARLGVKTTIEETRSMRLYKITGVTQRTWGTPYLPVPLKIGGAHTHRLSGDWQLNMQNLSSRKNRDIRNAIHALPSYVIISVDASQIEARLVAWLSGQMNLLQQFANGEDVYRNFAAVVFHVPLADVTKVQRFICKTCILGLGFGMSAATLLTSILNGAREQGLDLGEMTLEMCEEWVAAYRYKQFPKISGYWKIMSALIESMEKGNADGVEVGPCRIEGTTVIGPSGLRLYYDNLRYEEDEYWYNYGRMRKKIYGGKFLENIVQHLDRQHVLEAGLRTEFAARKLGIPDPRVVLNEHDANVYCVPQEYGLTLAELALKEMRRNCLWNVGLPLGAEVKMGTCFGELEKVQF